MDTSGSLGLDILTNFPVIAFLLKQLQNCNLTELLDLCIYEANSLGRSCFDGMHTCSDDRCLKGYIRECRSDAEHYLALSVPLAWCCLTGWWKFFWLDGLLFRIIWLLKVAFLLRDGGNAKWGQSSKFLLYALDPPLPLPPLPSSNLCVPMFSCLDLYVQTRPIQPKHPL